MSILSKDLIVAASDLKIETIEVPEWGGSVCIKTMSGFERDEYEAFCLSRMPSGATLSSKEQELSKIDSKGMRSFLLACVLCDEKGERVFDDILEGAKVLEKKNGGVLTRLALKAQEANGMTDSALKEVEKNYEADRND